MADDKRLRYRLPLFLPLFLPLNSDSHARGSQLDL
jgi:hypothetical protein